MEDNTGRSNVVWAPLAPPLGELPRAEGVRRSGAPLSASHSCRMVILPLDGTAEITVFY